MKSWKKITLIAVLTLCLLVFAVLFFLCGCGCDSGENAGMVFVNGSNTTIAAVTVEFEDQDSGVRHADSSPLKRGESFGFEMGEYPALVVAYEDAELLKEVGRVTVREAPPKGECWYVTARDGSAGLVLTVDINWPEGV